MDCLVIGAGVVGLAIARRIALEGREVLLVDKESSIGTQTSSRNSEVIHAGIYYPKGSLKAQLCVAGKEMLYDYCAKHHLPFKACGKLIVATSDDQIARLQEIKNQAQLNGVDDLRFIGSVELNKLEQAIVGKAALLSPSTGVLDSHAYMLQLQADLEANGGQCVFNSELQITGQDEGGVELTLNGGEALIRTKCCINSAGLNAQPLVNDSPAISIAELPKAFFAKGSYFAYSGAAPFDHLVYPVPEPGGLGVHLTLDMQGAAKFGPDVEWLDVTDVEQIDYKVDPKKREQFHAEVSKYWPAVELDKMHADYSGVRPKIVPPGNMAADFSIQGPADHGVAGLVNLLGIESPGLTSSLAIAEYVYSILKKEKL